MQSQTISGPGLGGLTLTQNYTYDAVNRLWTFAETGSTGTQTYNTNQNYNYDSFGNRWLTSSWIAPGMSGQTPTSDAFTNNQWGLNGVNGYDGAGNQTSIAGVNRTFYYDGENRQIMAVIGNPSTATTYNYDGEGRRVQKITTSGTTTYVYDAMGHLAAEYGGSSTSAGRVYLSVDALGSTRLVTDASGNPTEQYDYAPFGEELTQGIDGRVALYSTNQYPTTPDAVTEKFTSKERDAETGFDFFDARYYSAAQGRFTSPDEFKGGFLDAFTGQAAFQPGPLPYADLSDPQTLNKYSYVRNNPLRYIDPTGHDHEGAFGLVRDWMDVVEVKGSAGMSIGTSGQAGSVEYRAEATLIGVEAKTGLGGGNSEAKATTGVVFAGKAGPLAGTVKAGAQISSNGGPGAEISGEVGAGGAAVKVGVKSDANGVQAASTPNASADVKFGAEARLGVGVGIAINLSQLGRAAARTVDAARDTVQAAREFVAKKLQETVIIP